MNVFKYFRFEIIKELEFLASAGRLPTGLDYSRVSAEPPREAAHGDVSSNTALVLAKAAAMKPRDLAQLLIDRLTGHGEVIGAEIAGPGFINLRLSDRFWRAQLADALNAGDRYGDSDLGAGKSVNVEYVSANPTGPMHVGHGRGAVFGDVLAALLAKAGFRVTREYYINDAGAQVDVLARSAYLRYREALGQDIGAIPEGFYPGDYLKETGAVLAQRDGRNWLDRPEADWLAPVRRFAIDAMMDLIRADLAALGVKHDVFSSERALVEARGVERVLRFLEGKGLVYVGTLDPPKGKTPEDWEPRPQTLFRTTQFGDDVDRPLKKSDGSWTYFAADIAYHFDKYQRGFLDMIDVLGADHFGYIKRMQAAVKALSDGTAALDVKVCQLVNLLDRGELVKMSKRAGTFVTLREVIDHVGKDVVRFIMLTRRNDQPLDFDFSRVQEKTRDNPVFYVQYAHARAYSVLRHAREALPQLDLSPSALARGPLGRLGDSAELSLIKAIAAWPRTVEGAAEAHEPHRLAFYLYDLAAAFHALWNRGNEDATLRFLIPGDGELSAARLALVRGVANVIAAGLQVFGVEPVEEMR